MSNTTTSVKVTGLTALNVAALRLLQADHGLTVDLTATTATFPNTTPFLATEDLAKAAASAGLKYGAKGHPMASIPAVHRKLVRAIGA